ncbi:MAG: HAMP domain-containing protein [Proteobacteria bacterium]|nr:HAMP domain-containing protein [Pseudomonadota bacterium]
MSLKIKTLGSLLALVIVYTAAQGFIHRRIILPGFLALEKVEADKNIQRPIQAIDRELFHLSALVHDWSAWDDTYDFMVTQSETYAQVNLLPDDTFSMNHIQMFYFCDPSGKVLWSKIIDPVTHETLTRQDIPGQRFLESQAVFPQESDGGSFSDMERTGILPTPLGPLMISMRPVLTSSNQGPLRGTIIMGRFITKDALKDMVNQTEVPFELIPLNNATEATEEKGVLDVVQGRKSSYIDTRDAQNLFLYTALYDISKKPVYLVKTTMPRSILEKGRTTLGYSMISIVVSGVLLIILSMVLLHISILKPISDLSRHVQAVEEKGDLLTRLDLGRGDELGHLAGRFDDMLEKLSVTRSELLDKSYNSGLAGMTSDILHHGRNILMPMSHKIGKMKDVCRNLPRENIQKAMDELSRGEAELDRVKNLNRFLFLSTGQMLTALGEAQQLLEDISIQNNEMERLFGDLEKFSRSGSPTLEIAPGVLVQKALQMVPDELKERCEIHVGQAVSTLPIMKAESLVLMNVIASVLVHSAIFAAMGSDGPAKVQIDARTETRGDKTLIRFMVSGNGPKQDEGDLKKMFARNYAENDKTPRFSSLHWCSNVISAMGGELELMSSSHGTELDIILPMGGVA